MTYEKTSKPTIKMQIPGIVLTLLTLLGAVVFLIVIFGTGMVPEPYLAGISAGCLTALILTYVLTRNPHRKALFVIGIIWSLLCLVLFCFAGYFISRTKNTLEQVSNVTVETSNISFYVKKDAPAQTLADVQDETFGILKVLDRENTDEALLRLSDDPGITPSVKEYDGLTQLADALKEEEVGVIVLNQAYLALYEESEGYETFPDEIRALSTEILEHTVEPSKQEAEKETSQATDSAKQESSDVINIYISGSDTRESTLAGRSNSDVNIIASINPDTRKILLLTTPRDYYVPLSISSGVPDKLTHAGIYGVQVSMDTLSMLYDIDIDYYIRMNFVGFMDLIDALGGVEVYSEYDFEAGGYHFQKGMNTLNGEQALAFSRERYSFASGDRQRGKNQMAVINGVIQKASSPAILTKYFSILQEVQDCVETNIPYDLMAELVRMQLSDNRGWDVTNYSVDGTGDSQVPYSMSIRVYVMNPDYETVDHAKELLRQIAGN